MYFQIVHLAIIIIIYVANVCTDFYTIVINFELQLSLT